MTRFFSEQDVQALLPMEDAISAVEGCFKLLASGDAVNRPRTRVRAEKLLLHVMPGGSATLGYVGVKSYTTGPGGARFYFLLFDAKSGELAALLEADALGQIRTGAASGVATRHLTAESAGRVGIYGAGWQARSQVEAIARVRSLESVLVYSPREERRRKFSEEMSQVLDVRVTPVDDPRQVAAEADILVTATSAREPVLFGEWLSPGQHVNAIGSNHLKRREIDEAVVTRSTFIVTDSLEQAKIECGDLAAVVDNGKLAWEDVFELQSVVSGDVAGRENPSDITLFESQGLAIEDVAVAKHVFERGLETGAGTTLPMSGASAD